MRLLSRLVLLQKERTFPSSRHRSLASLRRCGFPSGSDWKQAIGPWKWSFPRDHGSHPDFRTEWWYFTGNLSDPLARRFGYQLTFFRQGVIFEGQESCQSLVRTRSLSCPFHLDRCFWRPVCLCGAALPRRALDWRVLLGTRWMSGCSIGLRE